MVVFQYYLAETRLDVCLLVMTSLAMMRLVMLERMLHVTSHVLIEVLVLLFRGSQCRACKHHQQENGGKYLSHAKNLARKRLAEVCFASSLRHACTAPDELLKA